MVKKDYEQIDVKHTGRLYEDYKDKVVMLCIIAVIAGRSPWNF